MNIKTGLLWVISVGLFCLVFSACNNSPGPRFELISPEQSGVTFENKLEETVQQNIFSYLYFYNGGGVAAGDLNGDGLPDLYFTSNQGENSLYLNRGDFKFEDITDLTEVKGAKGWATGVTMADVNADGKLDIYVSQLGDYQNIRGKNQLYINQGNNEEGIPLFKDKAEAYGLDLVGFSTQAAFFDYDLDGDLDMYMLNHSVHSNGTFAKANIRSESHPLAGDKLLRNDDGKFVDVSRESGIYNSALGYGLGITVADINWDGFPDIYIGNDFHENDYLYINKGDGTFTESAGTFLQHSSRYSMGNDVADFNNDGLPDILSLDMLPGEQEKLKASAAEEAYDIYNFKLSYGYSHQFARNTLQLNLGNGKFSEIGLQAGIAATDWSWSGLFADLDLDGYKDIYIANGIKRRSNDLDYINYVSSEAIQSRLAGNLTEEDLLLTEKMPQVKIPNAAFRNTGNLKFEDVSESWGLNQDSFSNGATYADLDGDGDLDLVTNNIDQKAFIYKNLTIEGEKADNQYLKIKLEGEGANTQGIGTKIIIPKKGELLIFEHFPTRGYQSAVSNDLTVGLGQDNMVDSLIVVWPDHRFQVLRQVKAKQVLVLKQTEAAGKWSFAKKARDQLFSDISSSHSIAYEHQENPFIEFNREGLIPHMSSTEGPKLAVADVNGDGLEDVFVGGAKRQPGSLLLQTEQGFVASNQALLRADSLAEDIGALFLDYDQDSDQDLVVVSGGNEFQGKSNPLELRFYLNDGGGNFSRDKQAAPGIFVNGSCVKAVDYDQDGDQDLFIGGRVLPWNYGSTPNSFLLENQGNGRFKDITAEVEGLANVGMVTDAAWVDLDGNGFEDLVVVGEWMPVTVFYNQQGSLEKSSSSSSLAYSNGWWNTLEVADVDQDGDPDLVVGNLGLNSKYRASKEEPVSLFVNDFDGNGKTDPLIYHYVNGQQYLFATKDELVGQLRELKGKFVNYADFARAHQIEIFDDKLMQEAEKHEAYEFRSGIFLNEGEGDFYFQPFPPQAQASPIQAFLLKDFDGDGQVDILSGGNQYEVNIQRGRYDADYGTFMRNEGNGQFSVLLPAKTGLLLEGQVRDMKFIKLQDKEHVLVAINNAPLQLIQLNNKALDKKVLTVK